MSGSTTSLERARPVSEVLARDRLGVPAVTYFVLSGVAPETVAAGVLPTAFAVTGLTAGVPATFLAVAAVLGLFAVGYVAMARQVTNAGAFYAFVSRGLGRPAGVAAALVAVFAYNLLQVGLYGAIGPFAAGLAESMVGIRGIPWWVFSLVAWAVVTLLGQRRVDLNGRVLAALGTVELVVVLALTGWGLTHPAGGTLSFAALSPAGLATGGVGALIAIAVLGFVGFESGAVFAEESRNPHRTVRAATYLSLVVVAVVYAGASWAMVVYHGDGRVAAVAGELGPETLFTLGGGLLANAGRVLFATSLLAAMIAFHQAVSRYLYALGRERVLPAALARTGRDGTPRTASLAQSALGLAVIVTFALAGWDPMVHLFFWLGTTGGFGVLLLVTATSFAIIRFFAVQRREAAAVAAATTSGATAPARGATAAGSVADPAAESAAAKAAGAAAESAAARVAGAAAEAATRAPAAAPWSPLGSASDAAVPEALRHAVAAADTTLPPVAAARLAAGASRLSAANGHQHDTTPLGPAGAAGQPGVPGQDAATGHSPAGRSAAPAGDPPRAAVNGHRRRSRHPETEPAWRRWIAPGIAGLALTAMVVLVVANYATLLGVPAGAPVSRLLPGCYGVVIIGALIWAWVLRLRDPAAYRRIGLDLDAPEPRQSAGGAR